MSGTKEGAKKAQLTKIKKYGKDFFREMGRKGGKACVPKGFAMNRELASEAGRKGGKISRRYKIWEA